MKKLFIALTSAMLIGSGLSGMENQSTTSSTSSVAADRKMVQDLASDIVNSAIAKAEKVKVAKQMADAAKAEAAELEKKAKLQAEELAVDQQKASMEALLDEPVKQLQAILINARAHAVVAKLIAKERDEVNAQIAENVQLNKVLWNPDTQTLTLKGDEGAFAVQRKDGAWYFNDGVKLTLSQAYTVDQHVAIAEEILAAKAAEQAEKLKKQDEAQKEVQTAMGKRPVSDDSSRFDKKRKLNNSSFARVVNNRTAACAATAGVIGLTTGAANATGVYLSAPAACSYAGLVAGGTIVGATTGLVAFAVIGGVTYYVVKNVLPQNSNMDVELGNTSSTTSTTAAGQTPADAANSADNASDNASKDDSICSIQ